MATSSVSPLWLFGATFWFIILSPSDWWFISIIVSLIYVVRTALFKQKILSSIQNLKFIAELSIMRSCSTMNRFNWSESINLTRSARLNDLTRDDIGRQRFHFFSFKSDHEIPCYRPIPFWKPLSFGCLHEMNLFFLSFVFF